jgi:hypothetical protein
MFRTHAYNRAKSANGGCGSAHGVAFRSFDVHLDEVNAGET